MEINHQLYTPKFINSQDSFKPLQKSPIFHNITFQVNTLIISNQIPSKKQFSIPSSIHFHTHITSFTTAANVCHPNLITEKAIRTVAW